MDGLLEFEIPDYEVEGQDNEIQFVPLKVGILFGNLAIEQFIRLGSENRAKGIESELKAFSDMIFSGMVNYSVLRDTKTPMYSVAYKIAERIFNDAALGHLYPEITQVYTDSRATQKHMESLREMSTSDTKKKTKPKKSISTQ